MYSEKVAIFAVVTQIDQPAAQLAVHAAILSISYQTHSATPPPSGTTATTATTPAHIWGAGTTLLNPQPPASIHVRKLAQTNQLTELHHEPTKADGACSGRLRTARSERQVMPDELEQVTIRLVDGTTEIWDAAEMLANGVLKVSKAAPAEQNAPKTSEIPGVEVTYYAAHAWVAVIPSMTSGEPIRRGLYI